MEKKKIIQEEYSKSLKERILKHWPIELIVLLGTMFLVLSNFPDAWENLSKFYHRYFEKSKHIFSENDPRLKVIYLPFLEISKEGNEDIADILKKRLDSLNRIDNLDINTCYFKRKISQQFNEDSAKLLLENEKVDLLIYGDYYNLSNSSHEISLSYTTSEKLDVGGNIKNKISGYKSATLKELRNGKIQGDVEFIVYWIKSLSILKTWIASLPLNDPKSTNSEALIYLRYLNKCIDLNPGYAEAYFNRGIIKQICLKKDEGGLVDYNKAIELNPNYINAYWNRGAYFFSIKNFNAAIRDYIKVTELDTISPDAFMVLGQLYSSNKNEKAAIKYYSIAINLGLSDNDIYSLRGDSYFVNGEFCNAIKDYTCAISLDSNLSTTWAGRARAYYQKNIFDSAAYDNNRAIDINCELAMERIKEGSIYLSRNRKSEAMIQFNVAIELYPYLSDAYFKRGIIYKGEKEFDKAISDFSKAITLNSKYAEAYWERGVIYKEIGSIKESDKDFQAFNLLRK
jgi:tetratricopeptide (TPR) repeat protein